MNNRDSRPKTVPPVSKKPSARQLSRRRFLLLCGLGCAGLTGTFWLAEYWRSANLLAALTAEGQHVPRTTGQPGIVPRTDWGAFPPDHSAADEYGFYSADNPEGWRVYDDDLRAVYHTAVIHHSGYFSLDDESNLWEVQRFQREERHWADVGYHYLVGRSGAIYEGRALNVRGAHVEGHNTGSVGICLLGDYRWQFPSESQIYATRCLIRWLSFGLNLTYLAGHCDLNDGTVCPGNNLVPYLAALADRAGLMPGAGAA